MSSERNYYEILNSTSNANFDELKRNYKQLILQCHPDKLQQDNSEAVTTTTTADGGSVDPNVSPYDDREFVIINEAWNTLKDPIKRKHYDAELLLTKFQAHSNIFERLTLADMEEQQENEHCEDGMETYYAYNCRCGGQYVIDESAATENGIYKDQKQQKQQHKAFTAATATIATATANDCNSASNDFDDVADVDDKNKVTDTNDCEVMVECSECSLVIILSNVKEQQQQQQQQQSSTSS